MKRLTIVAAVLLLAGCSSSPEKIAGQVISCNSLESTVSSKSINLD